MTSTSPTIHSTFDLFKMEEELEKFQFEFKETGTLKMVVDFSVIELAFEKKQMEIGDIKYKKPKTNLKKIVDPIRKSKSKNLF